MPVCSYLVFPATGARDAIVRRLGVMPWCELTPAENADLMVLVTDTPDQESEDLLRHALERIEGIESLVLTFGAPGLQGAGAEAGELGRFESPAAAWAHAGA